MRADVQFDDFLARCDRTGWRLFDVGMVRSVRPWRDVRACWRLSRVIREFEPDVVHCHSSKAGALGRTGGTGGRGPVRVY
jgi:hypothetical protein